MPSLVKISSLNSTIRPTTMGNGNIYSSGIGGQSNQDLIAKHGESFWHPWRSDSATKENTAPTVNRNAVASKANGSPPNKSPPREKPAFDPEKTSKRCYVPLNERAKPIGVRIGLGGEVVEIPHCVQGKFNLLLS